MAGDLTDIVERELARCERRQGDPRVLSVTTATSGDGKPISWLSLKAGKAQVTFRPSELSVIARALAEHEKSMLAGGSQGATPASTPQQRPVQQPGGFPPPYPAPAQPSGSFGPGKGRPFPARYASPCPLCSTQIRAGENACMQNGKAVHERCPQRPAASPPAAAAAPSDGPANFDEGPGFDPDDHF